jgi:hypothetical protein
MSLGVLVVLSAYSQSAPTLDERARQLKAEAYKILANTPHRVLMTIEMRANEELPWELYSSQTSEVAAPKRRHIVQHTGLKREYIYFDGRTYSKIPESSWQLLPEGYTGPTVRQLEKPVVESAVTEKKGETIVETHGHSKLQLLRTGEIVAMDGKNKEWFDDSGRLIRAQSEHFNYERKVFQRNIEVYEYDPTIKVEPPIN